MKLRLFPHFSLVLGLWAVLTAIAPAQGFIIDQRPAMPVILDYNIETVDADVTIREQVAEVRLKQVIFNPNSQTIEAEFMFPLPEDVSVQDFVLIVDGKEYPGKVMNRDEARRVYEDIVRKRKDPALLELVGRGLFKTSVFPIPAGARRTLTLSYTQICPREDATVDFALPLYHPRATGKPVGKTSVNVRLESPHDIKTIYSPSHPVDITQRDDRNAVVKWSQDSHIHDTDFRLVYTLSEGLVGASLLSFWPDSAQDGFYMLLASPEIRQEQSGPQPKTVIFVLDRSGSMAGKKLEQSREALKFVVNNLNDGDLFNIITYDDRTEAFKPELQSYDKAARDEATAFISTIREGGSTNIDSALNAALDFIPDDNRPAYVIFLTDGLPTAGEQSEIRIAENCVRKNKHDARLFVFGVGYDVNSRLLDRLAEGNSGYSTYVKPDEDIEASVGGFYAKITAPVLSDIAFDLPGAGSNRIYPRDIPDLFHGGQLVLVGRYAKAGKTTIELEGHVGGEKKQFHFEANLAARGNSTRHDFVDRLWVNRRIGFLLDQVDLHGQSPELVDELVALSRQYGIMTPYTSFLADDQGVMTAEVTRRKAGERLDSFESVSGYAANNLRQLKQDQKSTNLGAGLSGGSFAESREHQIFAPDQPQVISSVSNAIVADELKQSRTQVRQAGGKTFYWRTNQWIDATLIDQENIQIPTSNQIKLYSDEYFAFIESLKPDEVRQLNFAQPVVFNLKGQNWAIVE